MNEAPLLSYSRRPRRLLIWTAVVVVLAGMLATALRAQISEADKKKRDAFLKAREEMRTIRSPTPSPTAVGKPKAAKKPKGEKGSETGEPVKTPSPAKTTKLASDAEDDEARPTATRTKVKSASPGPNETPSARKKNTADDSDAPPEETIAPRATTPAMQDMPPVRAVPLPTDAPVYIPPPADITVQKSGMEEEQGFEPPPPPPPRRGFFARLFGGGRQQSYRYLSRGVIDAIRQAPVQRSRWKFVIVHNSGTRQGNARAFDYYHRRVRRMQNGMAYHFVVGNGTSSGNGQVEIGDRWRRQINGGHVHSDYLNNISLGICLVGDFNRDRPTKTQLEATEELIKYLRERCGRGMGVRPHREMNPPRWATDCPGDAFPYAWFRRF